MYANVADSRGHPSQILASFPKLFVTFDVFLHMKTKVATVFAKLPIHRPHLPARICGFC